MKWLANSKRMENIFHTVCETYRLHTDKKLSRRNTRSVNDTSQKKGCSQPEKHFCFPLKQNSVIHTYYFLRRDLMSPLRTPSRGVGFLHASVRGGSDKHTYVLKATSIEEARGRLTAAGSHPRALTAPVNGLPYRFQCYLAILYHRRRACCGPRTAQHYLLFSVWARQPHH